MKIVKSKSSYRVSKVLLAQAEEVSRDLGIGKGDMISMGLAFFMLQMTPLVKAKKRLQIFADLEQEFQKLIKEQKKRLGY